MQLTLQKLSFILLVAYIALLCILCFADFSYIKNAPNYILGVPTDKIVHFLMFLPFPILIYFSFGRKCKKNICAAIFSIVTMICGCLFAGATEIGQRLLTTYRSCDTGDFIADGIAITIGCILILIADLCRIKNEVKDVA